MSKYKDIAPMVKDSLEAIKDVFKTYLVGRDFAMSIDKFEVDVEETPVECGKKTAVKITVEGISSTSTTK